MRENTDKTQWYLEGETRDKEPWIIPLSENFSIGRLETSDLILSSGSVSRHHAKMNFSDDDLYIQDLESSNGTFVNGARIKGKSLLRDGDLLQIGQTEFRVSEGMPASREQKEHTIVGVIDQRQDFSSHFGLSERETEILYFLVKGFNLQDIGEKLFISPGTVKNHVLKIYKKTGSHSRIELATSYREFDN